MTSTCPREATVAALWDQPKKDQVIYVRGTPTSGKSTLAQLLQDYVMRTRPTTQVYSFSWIQPEVLPKEGFTPLFFLLSVTQLLYGPANKCNRLAIYEKYAADHVRSVSVIWQPLDPILSAYHLMEMKLAGLFSSHPTVRQLRFLFTTVQSDHLQYSLLLTNESLSVLSPITTTKFHLYVTRPEFDDAVARQWSS